jgi:hypothetical protein
MRRRQSSLGTTKEKEEMTIIRVNRLEEGVGRQ